MSTHSRSSPPLLLLFFFQISSDAKDVGEGEQAAATIFRLTDEPLNIDPLSDEGAKPGVIKGALEFKNIFFAYPSRPDMQVGDQVELLYLLLYRNGKHP